MAADPAAVRSIQQRLLRDDAYLIGHTNEDPHDRRTARIRASSAQAEGCAAHVVSGQSRAVHGEWVRRRIGPTPAPTAG
ncbi:MAG: hypothetical protein R2838_21890 [Caldilineaceae bacterium]